MCIWIAIIFISLHGGVEGAATPGLQATSLPGFSSIAMDTMLAGVDMTSLNTNPDPKPSATPVPIQLEAGLTVVVPRNVNGAVPLTANSALQTPALPVGLLPESPPSPEAPLPDEARPARPARPQSGLRGGRLTGERGEGPAPGPTPGQVFSSWLVQAASLASPEAKSGMQLAEQLVPELASIGKVQGVANKTAVMQASVETFGRVVDFFPWVSPTPPSPSGVNGSNIIKTTKGSYNGALINSTSILNSTNIQGNPVIDSTNVINGTSISGFPVINGTHIVNSTYITGMPVLNSTNVINSTNFQNTLSNSSVVNRTASVGPAGNSNGQGNSGTGNGNGNGVNNNNNNVNGDTQIGIGLGGNGTDGGNSSVARGVMLTIASPHSQAITMTGVNLTLSNVSIYYVNGAGSLGSSGLNLSALISGANQTVPARSVPDVAAAHAAPIIAGSDIRLNDDGSLNALVAPGTFINAPEAGLAVTTDDVNHMLGPPGNGLSSRVAEADSSVAGGGTTEFSANPASVEGSLDPAVAGGLVGGDPSDAAAGGLVGGDPSDAASGGDSPVQDDATDVPDRLPTARGIFDEIARRLQFRGHD